MLTCWKGATYCTRGAADSPEQLDALASLLHHTWRDGAALGPQVGAASPGLPLPASRCWTGACELSAHHFSPALQCFREMRCGCAEAVWRRMPSPPLSSRDPQLQPGRESVPTRAPSARVDQSALSVRTASRKAGHRKSR